MIDDGVESPINSIASENLSDTTYLIIKNGIRDIDFRDILTPMDIPIRDMKKTPYYIDKILF